MRRRLVVVVVVVGSIVEAADIRSHLVRYLDNLQV